MIFGIDGNEANIENRVGVNQYAAELLIHLEKLPESTKHEFVIYLRDEPLDHMPKPRLGWKYEVLSGRGMWIIKTLMPHLWFAKYKPDIFFAPSHYLPPILPMPGVMSIMDLGYLNSREQFKKYDFYQLKYWGALSMWNAKKIIAISQSTKNEIVKNYSWAKNKINVTHLAYDKSKFNTNVKPGEILKVKSKYKIKGEYILFLSTIKPSKNIEGLIEAFSLLDNNLVLVIAGKKGWHYNSVFEKVEKLGLKSRVIFTDFITEEDKAPLMAGAKIFALPSFWEGFGIPVLEAMACGVPVVVSNIGSLPEIVGSAGIYVNPSNPKDIERGLEEALKSRSVLSKKGLLHVREFNWDKTARETLEVLVKAN